MFPWRVDSSFLSVDPLPDGKIACGSGGLTVVVVQVRVDPVFWPDVATASSVLAFALVVLKVNDFERR